MGEMMKIWLPGESPWAEVLSVNDDGSRVVRIDNKVAGDYSAAEFRDLLSRLFHGEADPKDAKDYRQHAHKFNDVLTVRLTDAEPHVWAPVEMVRH